MRWSGSSSSPASARERQNLVGGAGVQHVAPLEPGLARDADSDLHGIERDGGMRIGPDGDRHSERFGTPQVTPIEIEPVRIGVELDRGAHFARTLQHRVEVEIVGFA